MTYTDSFTFLETKRKKSTVQQVMAIVTMVKLNLYEAASFTEVIYWKVFFFSLFFLSHERVIRCSN